MMLVVSVLAVLILIGVAWAMGFRASPVLDDEGARQEAEGRLAGFRAVDVALAVDGRGAILRGQDGSLALLLPFGDGWLSRHLSRGTGLLHQEGTLIVKLGEPMMAEARLPLERLPAWLQEGVA